MLAALAYWGFTVGDGAGAWALGVGAPLLAAIVWGAWVAPKARWPVPIPTRVAIELILFGAAVGALAVAGQPLARAGAPAHRQRRAVRRVPGLVPGQPPHHLLDRLRRELRDLHHARQRQSAGEPNAAPGVRHPARLAGAARATPSSSDRAAIRRRIGR